MDKRLRTVYFYGLSGIGLTGFFGLKLWLSMAMIFSLIIKK